MKNLKRFFVSIFILLFSLISIVNITTFASHYDYSGKRSYSSYDTHAVNFSSSEDAYLLLCELCNQTITPLNIIPEEISNDLKAPYSFLCKNLFYLFKYFSQDYCSILCHLNYATLVMSQSKINLRKSLEFESFETIVKELYSEIIKECNLAEHLPSNKESLNLFDVILVYSYLFNLDDSSPTKEYLHPIRQILIENGINPENFSF